MLPSVTSPDNWVIVDFPFYRILSGGHDGTWRLSSKIETIEKTSFGYEVTTNTGTLYKLSTDRVGLTKLSSVILSELSFLAKEMDATVNIINVEKVVEDLT